MKLEEAREITQKYVDSLGEVMPAYKYDLGDARDFIQHFYFENIWARIDGQPLIEPPVAGGSCGFIIHKKTREIKSVSFGGLAAFSIKKQEIDTLFELLSNVQTRDKSLNN